MSTGEIVAAILTSSAFTTLVLELVRELRRAIDKRKNQGFSKLEQDVCNIAEDLAAMKEDIENRKEIDNVLLHDRLWQAFRFFSDKDAISVEDRANIDYLYDAYTGNHKAEIMYKYICSLPIIPDTEDEMLGE